MKTQLATYPRIGDFAARKPLIYQGVAEACGSRIERRIYKRRRLATLQPTHESQLEQMEQTEKKPAWPRIAKVYKSLLKLAMRAEDVMRKVLVKSDVKPCGT
jgi:hypothetical protein